MSELSVSDRNALADLVARYASSVDRRDYAGIADLFEPDARMVILRDGEEPDVLDGPEAIALVIEQRHLGLLAKSHLLGQQRASVEGDDAEMETYCLAQHLSEREGQRWNRIMNIRYIDTCRRGANGWRFVERRLLVDWVEHRVVGPSPEEAEG